MRAPRAARPAHRKRGANQPRAGAAAWGGERKSPGRAVRPWHRPDGRAQHAGTRSVSPLVTSGCGRRAASGGALTLARSVCGGGASPQPGGCGLVGLAGPHPTRQGLESGPTASCAARQTSPESAGGGRRRINKLHVGEMVAPGPPPPLGAHRGLTPPRGARHTLLTSPPGDAHLGSRTQNQGPHVPTSGRSPETGPRIQSIATRVDHQRRSCWGSRWGRVVVIGHGKGCHWTRLACKGKK